MNNYYLNDELKRYYDEKRYNAQNEADMNLHFARQQENFTELENKIGDLTINLAKAKRKGLDPYPFEKQILECKIEQDNILAKHNLNLDDLKIKYECQLCNDTGFTKDNKQCVCAKKIINKMLKEKCGMPLLDVTFENCKDAPQNTVDIIKRLCAKYPTKITKTNVLLSGQTGTGKTYLTYAMANEFINKQLFTIFTTALHLVTDFWKCHTTFDETKMQYYTPYLDCDVLIIDDLGTEPTIKNVSNEYLLNLINERQMKQKLTIITTNLGMKELLDKYNERIFSRLTNKALSVNLIIDGTDLRTKKEKKEE